MLIMLAALCESLSLAKACPISQSLLVLGLRNRKDSADSGCGPRLRAGTAAAARLALARGTGHGTAALAKDYIDIESRARQTHSDSFVSAEPLISWAE